MLRKKPFSQYVDFFLRWFANSSSVNSENLPKKCLFKVLPRTRRMQFWQPAENFSLKVRKMFKNSKNFKRILLKMFAVECSFDRIRRKFVAQCLNFQTHTSPDLPAWILDQGLNRQLYTWGGLFNRKTWHLGSCVGNLIVQKDQKVTLILIYPYIQIDIYP